MTVSPPVFARDFPSSGAATLVQPVGIAVSGDRVYVADAGRGLVDVYDTAGSLVATMGASRLKTPVYVAVSPLDGHVYVSDRGSRSIAVFGADGRFVRAFEPADPAGKVAVDGWQPLALAFADDGTLYVSDVGARQRVLAFGPDDDLVGQTGADLPLGASGKSLSFANGLAAGAGRVLVADSNNSRVLVLGPHLEFLGIAPFAGLPRGMAALSDDLFVVVDTTGSELRLIGPDAATVERAAAKGSGVGELLLPTAVASDGKGEVFVTDTGNRRVSVWKVSGAVRRSVLQRALYDPRWWGVAAVLLVGIVAGGTAWVVGRNRRHTI